MSAASSHPVTFSFTTSLAEQSKAARLVYRLSWGWRIAMVIFTALPLALAGVLAVVGGTIGSIVPLVFGAIASAAFWNYRIPSTAIRAARKGLPQPDGPFTWVVDESGCRWDGPNGSMTLRWSAIVKVRETADFFLLFVSANAAHFLPRRAVPAADLPRLRDLFARATAPL
jgi:hypothetical protein